MARKKQTHPASSHDKSSSKHSEKGTEGVLGLPTATYELSGMENNPVVVAVHEGTPHGEARSPPARYLDLATSNHNLGKMVDNITPPVRVLSSSWSV